MGIFESKLLRKGIIAKNTMAVDIQKPVGFDFKAGQYITVSIGDNQSERMINTRALTIASAPYESVLTVIFRLSESDFKRKMFSAPIGKDLHVEGPFGDFTLDRSESGEVTFIAGGMGVSPFMSMIKEALAEEDLRSMQLLYLCRSIEEAPFIKIFDAWRELNSNFIFRPMMTGFDKPDNVAHGDSGQKMDKLLQKYMPKRPDDVYVAGPKGMVSSVISTMNKKHFMGRVFTDEFSS